MTCCAKSRPEERPLIPNVKQLILRNSIKITKIDQTRIIHDLKMKNVVIPNTYIVNKRVIHALEMNNRDKYQSSLSE